MTARNKAAWVIFATTAAAYALTLTLEALGPRPEGAGFSGILLAWLAYAAIGALVASRRPENAVGRILLGIGASGVALGLSTGLGNLAVERPGLLPTFVEQWVLRLLDNLWVVSFALIGVLVLVFPTGRPPTARWKPFLWATGVLIVIGLLTSGRANSPAEGQSTAGFPLVATLLPPEIAQLSIELGRPVVGIGQLLLAGTAAASMVVRFRRSVGIERQQLKWFAFAASLFAVVLVATAIAFFSPLRALDPAARVPPAMFGGVPFILAVVALPLSAAIAILRYRLYDIDVLINRALVYGGLSASLVAAYVGSVLLLQAALRPFTAGSDIAVAMSTLGVVALFQPLRRRIQDAVDRRFYRSRYDAQRALDTFAGRLRDEIDLRDLERELVTVVAETVHPQHAGLWLRKRP